MLGPSSHRVICLPLQLHGSKTNRVMEDKCWQRWGYKMMRGSSCEVLTRGMTRRGSVGGLVGVSLSLSLASSANLKRLLVARSSHSKTIFERPRISRSLCSQLVQYKPITTHISDTLNTSYCSHLHCRQTSHLAVKRSAASFPVSVVTTSRAQPQECRTPIGGLFIGFITAA